MTTDFRTLCAELYSAVQLYTGQNPASAEIPSNQLVRQLMDAMAATAAALAQPEPQGPTDEEIKAAYWDAFKDAAPCGAEAQWLAGLRAVARFARPAIEPVPVTERLPGCASERFEFSVLDSEYEEQAGGTAPTYSQALSEGLHYLAVYSQDGPHSLELRRVEVLPHHALPVPQQGADRG